MAYINMKIEGMTEVLSHYKEAPEFIFKQLNNAIELSMNLVWRNVRLVTPVKTGNLRAGIRPEPTNKPLYRTIMPHNAPYAVYVEGRREFMQEGANNSTEDINKIVSSAVSNINDFLTTK